MEESKPGWIRKPAGDAAVVFVHGILSDPSKAWRMGDVYWPALLAQEPSLSVGVYVFSYRTSLFSGGYSVSDAADALHLYLKRDGLLGLRSLVFVCHSMGGIVTRRYMLSNQEELRCLHQRLGLFLVASPSLGSQYANWVSALAKMLQHSQAEILRFSQSNLWLNDLDKDFKKLKEELGIQGQELIEDKFIIPGLFRNQVVEPFSADRFFTNSLKIPNSDHFTIATPASKESIQHLALMEFLTAFLKKSQNVSPAVGVGRAVDGVSPLRVRLRRLTPDEEPQWHEFVGRDVRVGRSPKNDFVLQDDQVSWDHGVIALEGGVFVYRHLSRTNSTLVTGRGRQVQLTPAGIEETALVNQDRITIGKSTFAIELDPGTDGVYIGTTPERHQ